MKHIIAPRDLEEFGIIPLTGEADATFTRILYDLDRQGLKVFCTAFGLKVPPDNLTNDELHEWVKRSSFNASYNTGTAARPHLACVMISHSELRQLALFALGCDGAETIITTETMGVYGYYAADEERRGTKALQDSINELRRLYGVVNCINGWKDVNNERQVGDRMVHQMSGRIL